MKKVYKFMLVMLCGVLFISCGAKKLSDKYNEDTLKKASEEIIANLNDGNYDEIMNKSTDQMKNVQEKVKEGWEEISENLGEYKSISKMIFQEKDNKAIVTIVAKYEKKDVQFTLAFDEDMKLSGIFMK